MNIDRIMQFIKSLYAAIHTLSGRLEQVDLSAAEADPVVKSCFKRHRKSGDYYYIQLNPNKVVPNSLLKSYSEFRAVLDETMRRIAGENFQITRADLSFNSDNEADFETFKKLNRLLICCIAQAENVKNCYKASDLWTDRDLSIAIKSDMIEAENYNKELQANGMTETKNRLEFRSKRMTRSLEEEFMISWFERLDKAAEQFESVQQRYNMELIRIWNEDAAKPERERDFISVTAFLLRYKNCIFTRKQLQSFLEEIGVQNPESKAKKFKERHNIEFFSQADLNRVVKAIKNETRKYFNT